MGCSWHLRASRVFLEGPSGGFLGPLRLKPFWFTPFWRALNIEHLCLAVCGCSWPSKTVRGCLCLCVAVRNCSLLFAAVRMCACVAVRGCLWLFLGVRGCAWVFMAVRGCPWLLVAARGCSWLFVAVCGGPWLWVAVGGYSLLLVAARGCAWLFAAVRCCSWLLVVVLKRSRLWPRPLRGLGGAAFGGKGVSSVAASVWWFVFVPAAVRGPVRKTPPYWDAHYKTFRFEKQI